MYIRRYNQFKNYKYAKRIYSIYPYRNALDLAIAVILAGEIGLVVSGFVGDIMMPIIGHFSGGMDFAELKYTLSEAVPAVMDGEVVVTAAVAENAIMWGKWVNAIINLVIVGFVLFMIIKAYNKSKKKAEEAPAAPPAPAIEEVLLGEIRDLLQKEKFNTNFYQMKKVLMLAIGLATTMAFGQITEGEDDLVTVCKDTVDGWKKGGYFSLNGSQVSLTNWVAGGQNSVSINSLFGLYANLKKGSMTWENSLDFGYGLMNQGENLFSGDEKWIKTDDRLDITSKFGQKGSKVCYYAALTNFRTQTTAGYGADDNFTEISGFLAPAYWLTAIGMDYKPSMKEGSEFSLFVAPITSKLTFVNDTLLANAGAFGVDEAFIDDITGLYNPGKKFRSEFGGYMRIKYKTKLAENITFTTKLDLFSNYIDNPSRIDVNWENLLEIKVWKFLSATISTHLVYDDDVNISFKDYSGNETAFGPRVQFKEVFGLGLAWKFDQ